MIQQPDSPDALMSYTRIDDQHHKHYLTLFREQLSGEVSVQIGRKFHIFQDTEDIKWGEQFEQRIDNVLQSITFFVPILTPSFFNSKFCRYELKCFLEHEKQLGRNDLVLPVYFIRVPALEKPALCVNDPLAHALAARQRIDWRNLRFETFESSEVRRKLAQMAQHIADALEVPTNTVINELSGLERIESVWDDVVRDVRPFNNKLQAMLRDVYPVNVEGNTVVLLVKYHFHKSQIEIPVNRLVIESVLSEHLGSRYEIQCIIP